MDSPSLQDRVVLVTGGSSGIGRAAVQALARAGAKVVFAARGGGRGDQVAREIRAQGGEVRFVRADVSQAEEVERLVSEAVVTFGRLDAAFNNAATVEGALALTADFTEEQFDRCIRDNLKSVWLCLRREIRQMLAQTPSGGAIVNTSSVNGLGGASGGASALQSRPSMRPSTPCAGSDGPRRQWRPQCGCARMPRPTSPVTP
jgi:NAD(P)-dependent dehydrogenase (short-subunit alcohol dehydrogenase family)